MKLLTGSQRLSAFLAAQTPWVVIAAAALSFYLPRAFSWVHGDSQTGILGLIMLTMGMTLTTADFKILAARPWDITFGFIAQFTIMPGVAYLLAHVLNLPPPIAVGLILVGCCPGGVSSNIMSFLCKGDVAFSVGVTTASTVLAPIMTPFLMLHLAGKAIDVDAIGMFKSILLVTIAPIAIGFILNRTFSKRPGYGEALKLMPGISVLGLAAIVGGVVAQQGSAFFKSGVLIFIAVFLHNAIGYALGYLAATAVKMPWPKRRTLALEVGMQNAGLATVLSARHFPAMPEAAVASAVSCVWHSISGALLAGIFNALDRWFGAPKQGDK
jgi:BASS family bile acid:Na+ symporter